EAEKAAEALKKGEAEEALRHQDQATRELDRLTADLDRALKLSDDPREAARQLARLQEDLKKNLAAEVNRARQDGGQQLAEPLTPLEREQKAIEQAARQLSVPTRNKAAELSRSRAADQAAKATEAVQKDTALAQRHMEAARQALQRLANELPDLARRRQEALAEGTRLRQKQEEGARRAA